MNEINTLLDVSLHKYIALRIQNTVSFDNMAQWLLGCFHKHLHVTSETQKLITPMTIFMAAKMRKWFIWHILGTFENVLLFKTINCRHNKYFTRTWKICIYQLSI